MRLNVSDTESQWLVLKPLGTPELPFDDEYLATIQSTSAIEATWNWLPRISGGGTSFESYFAHMKKLTEQGTFFPTAVFLKPHNIYIGGASFMRASRTHRSLEIGFPWLKEGYRDWICFAALQHVMIEHALKWRAKRIVWNVSRENERMRRAMEKLGVKEEGVLRSAFRMNDGRWSDRVIYALVQDEIPEAIARLQKELEVHF